MAAGYGQAVPDIVPVFVSLLTQTVWVGYRFLLHFSCLIPFFSGLSTIRQCAFKLKHGVGISRVAIR
jgi:hypothetical protein